MIINDYGIVIEPLLGGFMCYWGDPDNYREVATLAQARELSPYDFI
jgi:hypothetical protein